MARNPRIFLYVRVLFDEIAALIQLICCSAHLISTAVYPYHDGFLFSVCVISFPYVQIQAVFTLMIGDLQSLASVFPEIICLIYSVIRYNINRCFPAIFTYWLFADKWNSLLRDYTVILFADKCTVDALYRKRFVVITSDFFVLAVLRSYFRLKLTKGFASFLC